jgi:23S rRNA (guanosine2251-2'-O)-methyltransferase
MQSRITFGVQAVRAALLRGRVERIYLMEDVGAKRLGRLSADIERSGAPVTLCPGRELERLTGSTKHQGVAAAVTGAGSLTEREAQELVRGLASPLLLVLDGVEDPRNFGAILRTADAAGVDLVVTARSRNVAVTPVVSKVASGAAESQPLAEVGNLARFLAFLAESGVRIVGTDDAAGTTLYDCDLTGPLALVMGAEGEGMRRLTREHCDALVSLPMKGVVESLNVAVAAGVCLFEAGRQRERLASQSPVR